PTAAARGAHVFPRLQRRPRGPLRQVLGFGCAKLRPCFHRVAQGGDRRNLSVRTTDARGRIALNRGKPRNANPIPLKSLRYCPDRAKAHFVTAITARPPWQS